MFHIKKLILKLNKYMLKYINEVFFIEITEDKDYIYLNTSLIHGCDNGTLNMVHSDILGLIGYFDNTKIFKKNERLFDFSHYMTRSYIIKKSSLKYYLRSY